MNIRKSSLKQLTTKGNCPAWVGGAINNCYVGGGGGERERENKHVSKCDVQHWSYGSCEYEKEL
jgi:hypothetical protein